LIPNQQHQTKRSQHSQSAKTYAMENPESSRRGDVMQGKPGVTSIACAQKPSVDYILNYGNTEFCLKTQMLRTWPFDPKITSFQDSS